MEQRRGNPGCGRGAGHHWRRRLWAALMALGVSGCDETTAPLADTAGQKASPLSEACDAQPPFEPNFEPELQWAWTGSPQASEFNQVMMTPVVVDVNADGVPDIVFSTFKNGTGEAIWKEGVLRAISGDDGRDLWANTEPAHRIKAASSIAAGDIDNDGLVEICGIPSDGRGIICYENDGTFKFRTSPDAFDYNEWGGPSLADLDGDGLVEILDGNRVYSHTGALKWVGADGMGGAEYTGPVSFAADLDGDGKQEVINGRSIYKHNGTPYCPSAPIPHGFAAVANFDEDSKAEIVVSGYGQVSLLDDNCQVLWTVPVPGGGHGGSPNIGDFDNDGAPEIGLPGTNFYSVLDSNGTLLWKRPTQELSSGKTGSTAFDFEDDGKLEIIYADEVRLRIYDGATGQVRFETAHSSSTTHENPVIADVDNDFAADLVVATNDTAYPGFHGIRVYHDKKEGWAHTRRIWNQHAYSITNINNDGTVPAEPLRPWLQSFLNVFRSNVAGYLGDNPFHLPDLLAFNLSAQCGEEGTLTLSATVMNLGAGTAASGLKVAFYKGDPASGGTLLGVATLDAALPSGGTLTAQLPLSSALQGAHEVFVVVDDDGTGTGRDTECDEFNNSASSTIELGCQETPANLPPVALCQDITVSADAACQASASINHGSHDPDHQPAPLSVSEAPAGPFGLGTHAVTLTASDGDASAQCEGTVTVVDTTQPAVSCPAPTPLQSCSPQGTAVTFAAATASDNCGASPVSCSHASGSTFPVGTTPVTCSAQDGSGNTASCGFAVTVVGDTTKPAVSCPASRTVESCSPTGAAVTYEPASSTDNCGAAPVSCSHASGSKFPVGTTPVSCSAQDASGNTASCGFEVKVKGDTTPPVISCPLSVEAKVGLGQIGVAVQFATSAQDTCGPATITCSHAPGLLFLLGLTPVTCTAKDASGNQASCQFGVRVSLDLSLP
ncbi:HYR domain-containing protein [Stigmatella sp. ncwal1]|uniref:HYR domain-containing protein n=1 Tax=Stigmatella ashevillensis TaxID=2995309 RepID=A0ABT5DB20_9BACT|nr:HYR domain-containing protein [Stigmatella ashevillena]MDC0710323.1 HYR domain-containing protein [Stigmatella ashevillena]